ncbi:MAG: IMP cyclohydrolase [Candidatus Curtissbacteria bacterium GW2011_GWA1_41_11]|uniref:IMP cyclohydrolase n=1 Tax=Candidatus Curtissbacteria bacterium GW2011_GWA1_41_11 TaxID=1618409 RepID=A0A0G0WU08_9BACT|nr:MAG: IMP cyclohydrolase [Candidatus Curtissbacteria bacterium GW2011_GWA1_41_11]
MNIFAAVFDKSILDPLLGVLDKKSVKFWGTRGTVDYLVKKNFNANSVVSGFDFDGRLKTLDKKVFAGILADKKKPSHLEELRRLARDTSEVGSDSSEVEKLPSEPFDLVIVDLYPLDKKNFPESMDIGGQALIRAAIKNYKSVAVAFDNSSLGSLVDELISNKGSTTLNFRKLQAQKAAKFIAEKGQLEADSF